MALRLWEGWPGRNNFCLNGFFLAPVKLCPCFSTLPIVLAITGAFFVMELGRLSNMLQTALGAAASFFLVLSVLSFIQATAGEPGFLPRVRLLAALSVMPDSRESMRQLCELYASLSRPPSDGVKSPGPEEAELLAVQQEFEEELLARFDKLSLAEEQMDLGEPDLKEADLFWNDVMADPRLKHLKFCRTCKIRRPPKSSHCSHSDNCVRDFDHYCFWIGNCVGARNHRAFLAFVLTTACLALVILTACLTDLGFELWHYFAIHGTEVQDLRGQVLAGLFAIALVILLGLLGTCLYRQCLQCATAGNRTEQRRRTVPVRRLEKLQTTLKASVAAVAAAWLVAAVVFNVLSLQPIILCSLVAPAAVLLLAVVREQFSNIGRGLNVKQKAAGRPSGGGLRGKKEFSFSNLVAFLTSAAPATLAPMQAEIPEDSLWLGDARTEGESSLIAGEEDEEPEDDYCDELGLSSLGSMIGFGDEKRYRLMASEQSATLSREGSAIDEARSPDPHQLQRSLISPVNTPESTPERARRGIHGMDGI
eukprot:TRINITY_DN43158_c0_g1_i1.p1 TRINITY_DN43158_c0_g1~~TRINITY_DN43158_c0_g1_i1.p1  ORF type:complete len:536 (-),score=108.43 TRINITY_DN43158_c0_g1_i1:50-1657(-)